VATNANLADVAKEIGLVRHIGSLDPRIKERTGEHHLGTIVEALLGAIHEDSGKDVMPVRRAMHQMGLVLPNWYTSSKSASYPRDLQKARFEQKTLDLHKATSEPSQPDLQKANELNRPELQKARSEPNQSELHEAKSETNRPDLHTIRSESDRFSIRKIHPERTPPKREIRRLKALGKLQHKIGQGLFVNEDSNQGNIGYQFQTVEEQVTSDGDFETLDAARARLEDMDTDEKSFEDSDTEHAVVEDVQSKQAHLEDQDADQTHFETSATHEESDEPTAAEFISSSWRELIRKSGDSSTKSETALRQKRGKSPATDFDNAIGAFMIESDGSMVERELVGGSEWPVRHGWFPQRCQITLDVALPKKKEVAAPEPEQLQAVPSLEDVALLEKPPTTNEVAFCELDGLLSASTSDDVAPKESLSKKELVAREPDRLPVASTPDDVTRSKKPRMTKKVASREPDRPLAAPTLDDIALPKLAYTTKAVAAYEPDRLRLIVAPL
jgi:hypothetical protein